MRQEYKLRNMKIFCWPCHFEVVECCSLLIVVTTKFDQFGSFYDFVQHLQKINFVWFEIYFVPACSRIGIFVRSGRGSYVSLLPTIIFYEQWEFLSSCIEKFKVQNIIFKSDVLRKKVWLKFKVLNNVL